MIAGEVKWPAKYAKIAKISRLVFSSTPKILQPILVLIVKSSGVHLYAVETAEIKLGRSQEMYRARPAGARSHPVRMRMNVRCHRESCKTVRAAICTMMDNVSKSTKVWV